MSRCSHDETETTHSTLYSRNEPIRGQPTPTRSFGSPAAECLTTTKCIHTSRLATIREELAKLNPNSRCCGAEINTLCRLRSHSDLALRKVVFFVSDTEDGRDTGEVLSQYLSARRDLDLEGAAPVVVEQLQDARPRDFRNHGLRNLVRRMGEQILQGGGRSSWQLIPLADTRRK